MPHIRVDDESDDDGSGDAPTPVPPGPFEYYPAEEFAYNEPHPFDSAALSGVAAVAYKLMRTAGVTHFRVRYDGGHDEGFAHVDGGRTVDGSDWPVDRLVAELSSPDRAATVRTAYGEPKLNPRTGRPPYWATLVPDQLVRLALDNLGDVIVGCLLGDGYGTGEYSMYGAVTADLTTGTLTDEPDVPRPSDVTFD